MVATEVRTMWHRAANSYFVQEDARRAPEFACHQSAFATSKLDDLGLVTVDEFVHDAVSFTHFNCKFSISYLSTAPWI